MSATEVEEHGADLDHGGDHDHDHPAWLAHHFDDPEQQFDSGKLGMWLFLVTEVLFFSGMFCAYALYRSLHPEVFEFASQYLNETLGAINTGVLLFSSLTMAWGVRCAQLAQRRGLVACLAMTLSCAAIFLGVKAIEYSHKFELGLLPAGLYVPQLLHPHEHEGVSRWLIAFSVIPALCLVGFAGWYGSAIAAGNKLHQEIAGPLTVTALCFFVGVGLGTYLESGEKSEHNQLAAHLKAEAHDSHSEAEEHGEEAAHAEAPAEASAATADAQHDDEILDPSVNKKGGAGLFFSIYYCMTGIHAIHILGGMAVLTWLLARSARGDFHAQYFGPVDYVGLYWHLVDFIWIYLFPLLYLIK